MERDSGQFSDVWRVPGPRRARFFYVTVMNLNPYKHARNCYAFLESAYDLSVGKEIPVQLIEFKWSGYVLPNATILPSSERAIDAFFVYHDAPEKPYFSVFSDSDHFIPRIKGRGDYLLTYMVISDNFSTVRKTFKMHLDNKLDNIELTSA